MKKYNFLFCILLTVLLVACNSEDIVCETTDPITIDPDPDPDPQETCDTGLLIMRSDGETGEPRFSLDSISKPINTPLAFQNIRQDQQSDVIFDVFNNPSNYDAYDAVNNQYYIEFPLQQRMYKYDIDTQARQEIIVSGFYSAPIFTNGNLLAISIDNSGYATDPANYTIDSINTTDGSLTTIASNSFPLQSYFNWESMSSVSGGNGIIYFISGSNLITYNTNTMMTQYIELVPGFDFTTNNQTFFGLKIRDNGNLLAIRDRDTDQGEGLELVEINTSNLSATPTVVFDFMANGIVLNAEFYSTTYDSCEDTYYITSRSDATTTDFYEIDLDASTFKTENFDFYLMGIESKND